ncbi:hypothetical protein [Streptosporangium sandarakinum]|uniref:hypothetical protein n=1 Tax=Streptosporangium sandarakinum TaxID=1260955 RepID=UPI003435FBDD
MDQGWTWERDVPPRWLLIDDGGSGGFVGFSAIATGSPGTYAFALPEPAPGAIRDLRDPDAAEDDEI